MKKKIEKESRSVALGTTIIVIVMVVVFGAVFSWMYSMDLLFLPDFARELLGLNDEGVEVSWELGVLSEIVRTEKNDRGETAVFDITYENLRAAFLDEPRIEGMFLSANISRYDDGKPTSHRIHYYINGNNYRAEIFESENPDKLETLKTADSELVVITDMRSGASYTVPRVGSIAPENEAGIPSVDELIKAVVAFPMNSPSDSDGASSVSGVGSYVENCDIKLVRTDNGNVYYISFTYPDIGLREEYYVSLDYHIIVSAKSSVNGVPVYSYEALIISTDPEDYAEPSLYRGTEMSEAADK